MGDEILPAGSENKGGDDQPKHQPDNKSCKEGGNNIPPPDQNNVPQLGFFRFTRDIFIAGILATGIWLVGEQFRDQGYVRIAHAVNFVACIAFFTVAPIEALKHWSRPLVVWTLFTIVIVAPLTFVFFGLKPKSESNGPTVFPQRIQLATDEVLNRKSVTISNPSEFPVYDVTLRIAINQPGVTASSLEIESDTVPSSQTEFGDNPVGLIRVNLLSTNKEPEIVYCTLGFIAGNSSRELRISGTVKTNSWADLSVSGYEKSLSLNDWKSNFTITPITPNGMWKDAKHGIGFNLADLPYGAVLLLNGKPAFTNLPHLCVGLDLSDFGGTNFFKLTDSVAVMANNFVRPGYITNLLTLPIAKSSSNCVIKFELFNDTGVAVSNINFVFNSDHPFNVLSNGVWFSCPEISESPSNDMVNMIRWAGDVRIESLSPSAGTSGWPVFSFGATNVNNFVAVGVVLDAKDMPQQLTEFWIMFCRTNQDSHSAIIPNCRFRQVFPEVSTNGIRINFPVSGVEFK